jgi:hypothetical protein
MGTLGGACVASNDLKVKRLRQESQRRLGAPPQSVRVSRMRRTPGQESGLGRSEARTA